MCADILTKSGKVGKKAIYGDFYMILHDTFYIPFISSEFDSPHVTNG